MASEYALRLKATLDTSSIQSELQKLRTAQQGGAGNGASGQGAGGGNNLGSLGNTLAKLNNSIVSLQRTIDALARTQKSLEATPQKGLLSKLRGMFFGNVNSVGSRAVITAPSPYARAVGELRGLLRT